MTVPTVKVSGRARSELSLRSRPVSERVTRVICDAEELQRLTARDAHIARHQVCDGREIRMRLAQVQEVDSPRHSAGISTGQTSAESPGPCHFLL